MMFSCKRHEARMPFRHHVFAALSRKMRFLILDRG